jgi:2-polyprenyl-3-methyl-5-hydroxy-6-metoxy-1,4-benzoquinol methylase
MLSYAQAGGGTAIEGVEAVREKNFGTICKFIKQKFPSINTILDVGCSRGLFLKAARESGFTPTGLEPDVKVAELCQERGYAVLKGFFPDAEVLSGKVYDCITFNDSFEHIPNLMQIINGIKKRLRPSGGCVVVNIPTSDGLMFNIALLLNKLGIRAPFNRMWQKGLASPHIHYFNKRNLRMLFENNGFVMKSVMPLPYYLIKGLWRRISCVSPFVLSVVVWTTLVLLYPLFRIWSDCFVSYFSFDGEPGVSRTEAPL